MEGGWPGHPHQRYSVCTVGDRAAGHQGLLAEGLYLLLGLNQHASTLRVPHPQVLQLGAHPQVLLGPRHVQQRAVPALPRGARMPGLRGKKPRL